jgi:hypothetical protein
MTDMPAICDGGHIEYLERLGSRGLFQRGMAEDTLQENLGKCGDRQWYTGQGKDDCVWLSENKFKIIEQVSRCSDIQKLKLVKDLICDSKETLR